MPLLNAGDSVGFISTSDGLSHDSKDKVDRLIYFFRSLGLNVFLSDTVYKRGKYFSGTPQERANELNSLFKNTKIRGIFDISGGDSCNQILPYVDFELIRNNKKIFTGYSDVSVLINAIYYISGIESIYFNLHNLYKDYEVRQKEFFRNLFLEGNNDKIFFPYSWINKEIMSGEIIGGNIRCFLKLTGTKYMPDSKGKILFLEAYSGNLNKIISLFTQIEQIGLLKNINGLIIGNFFEVDKNNETEALIEYIGELNLKYDLPIIRTDYLGHKSNCLGVQMGRKLFFNKNQ